MTEQDANKRQRERIRTLLAAHVHVGRGLPDVACQVRDISETGARIVIDERAFVSDRFELRIPRKGVSYQAQVRWRRGPEVGLEFVPDRRACERMDPSVRIRELEEENAQLRRRVAELADRLYAYGDSERSSI